MGYKGLRLSNERYVARRFRHSECVCRQKMFEKNKKNKSQVVDNVGCREKENGIVWYFEIFAFLFHSQQRDDLAPFRASLCRRHMQRHPFVGGRVQTPCFEHCSKLIHQH